MSIYIFELEGWPNFRWNERQINLQLASVRYRQGRLIGRMDALDIAYRADAVLATLTEEILRSSKMEGQDLDRAQVLSSIAQQQGMDISELSPASGQTEGVVKTILDATQKYAEPLTEDRLFGWHAGLFPAESNGVTHLVVGAWRTEDIDWVVGPDERVVYAPPDAKRIPSEMYTFLKWYNDEPSIDPVLKAALAYLWFVSIQPFDDGNDFIARALADMMLARSELSSQRFYSLSAQMTLEQDSFPFRVRLRLAALHARTWWALVPDRFWGCGAGCVCQPFFRPVQLIHSPPFWSIKFPVADVA